MFRFQWVSLRYNVIILNGLRKTVYIFIEDFVKGEALSGSRVISVKNMYLVGTVVDSDEVNGLGDYF